MEMPVRTTYRWMTVDRAKGGMGLGGGLDYTNPGHDEGVDSSIEHGEEREKEERDKKT